MALYAFDGTGDEDQTEPAGTATSWTSFARMTADPRTKIRRSESEVCI